MTVARVVTVALLAALVAPARAADVPVEVALTIESNRFTPEEIRVPAGKPFVLVVTNKDKAAEEFESKELRIEKIIPGGKTVRLRFHLTSDASNNRDGIYLDSQAVGCLSPPPIKNRHLPFFAAQPLTPVRR